MAKVDDEILRIEAALTAQEGLRPTLGDAVVDVTVAALRTKHEALQAERQREAGSGAPARGADGQLLERLRRHIPRELAEKMRVLGLIEGERKRVTVLSARLSGFTALGERLEPEELTSLTSDTIHELAEAIYQYEGAIDRFVGDDVTAIFGAPIAHEDDPERALRAALAMRERIEGINRRWSTRLEQPLSLHIGINTGELITGQVGPDLRQDCTFTGDTVSAAVRLREAARSGQVFVSGNTWRLTHASFDFAALEPLPPRASAASRSPSTSWCAPACCPPRCAACMSWPRPSWGGRTSCPWCSMPRASSRRDGQHHHPGGRGGHRQVATAGRVPVAAGRERALAGGPLLRPHQLGLVRPLPGPAAPQGRHHGRALRARTPAPCSTPSWRTSSPEMPRPRPSSPTCSASAPRGRRRRCSPPSPPRACARSSSRSSSATTSGSPSGAPRCSSSRTCTGPTPARWSCSSTSSR